VRLPFTDAHMHLWDSREPGLKYYWLAPGGDPGETEIMGEYGAVRCERYTAEDYIAETRFQNVDCVIHVQSADANPADPLVEARWVDGFRERFGIPHAIIGYADLAAPNVREVIALHREIDVFRGIRDLRADDYLENPRWEEGVAYLAEHELVLCDEFPIERAPLAAGIAQRNPGLTCCLDHALFPRLTRDGDFERWRDALRTLAAVPNTVIKISALGMVERRWTPDLLRERILTCIETFGVERSFFAANWPMDRLYSSYGDLLDCFAEVIADFSPAEQLALFNANAKRIFRVS
jgi:predicted TIM-barrel fold metal-dependent hydrolase